MLKASGLDAEYADVERASCKKMPFSLYSEAKQSFAGPEGTPCSQAGAWEQGRRLKAAGSTR